MAWGTPPCPTSPLKFIRRASRPRARPRARRRLLSKMHAASSLLRLHHENSSAFNEVNECGAFAFRRSSKLEHYILKYSFLLSVYLSKPVITALIRSHWIICLVQRYIKTLQRIGSYTSVSFNRPSRN